MIRVYPASLLTRGRRGVRGRPRKHCRVTRRAALQVCITDVQCAQQDWARACPATRAASCLEADSGRTASARSVSIGSIMPAPSYAIDHHRSKPSPGADLSSGHQAPMLLRDAGGCDDGSAARCTCSRACPRWPTLIRRRGVLCTSEKRANRWPERARSVQHTSGEADGAGSGTIPAPECALSVFRNQSVEIRTEIQSKPVTRNYRYV
jgi:hypothetical protein